MNYKAKKLICCIALPTIAVSQFFGMVSCSSQEIKPPPVVFNASLAGEFANDVILEKTTVTKNNEYSSKITPKTEGKVVTIGGVTIDGVPFTGYTFNNNTIIISSDHVTGNIVITPIVNDPLPKTFSVSLAGEFAHEVVLEKTTAVKNNEYTSKITPKREKAIVIILSVTINGVAFTEYTFFNNIITISGDHVAGNIVITPIVNDPLPEIYSVSLAGQYAEDVVLGSTMASKDTEYSSTITPKTERSIVTITCVTINGIVCTDYTFDNNKIVIPAIRVKGNIVITPKAAFPKLFTAKLTGEYAQDVVLEENEAKERTEYVSQINPSDGHTPLGISKVLINGVEFKEYKFSNNVIKIPAKNVTGDIIITPKLSYKVPKVIFHGDMSDITKETETELSLSYDDQYDLKFDADILIKVQGASSAGFDKKNYNIKMFEPGSAYQTKAKYKMQPRWKKDNKFTLKANYVDPISIHNVGCAQLWGDVVHQQHHVPELSKLLNGGAIDGFPVECWNDSNFLGAYTWNLKKHEDLFGMETGEHLSQAMVLTKDWNDYVFFKQPIDDLEKSGFDVEFCSTESRDWIKDSLNRFINFIINVKNRQEFISNINAYSDLNMLVDFYLFVNLTCGIDNYAKNLMWVTFDGQKWLPSIYDVDITFGLVWPPVTMVKPDFDFMKNYGNKSLLLSRIHDFCSKEIEDEYKTLKLDSLSCTNITNKFNTLWNKLTPDLYQRDIKKWPEDWCRGVEVNTIGALRKWIVDRTNFYLN